MNKWIDWMAENHVTANLLMLLIILGGIVGFFRVPREVFPTTEIPVITVSVVYPGASPDKIEQSLVTNFEDAFTGLSGVRRITSVSSEGVGTIWLELEDNVSSDDVRSDVNTAIDRIENIPEEAREPTVSVMEIELPVMRLGIFGDVSERELKELGEEMQQELRSRRDISRVNLFGTRNYEISLEVSPQALEKYNLSFADIERAVKSSSLDVPGGTISSSEGEITLRTRNLAEAAYEFESIPVRSWPDGRTITIKDLGMVRDGFEDENLYTGFNGKEGALLVVSRVGDQSALVIAESVKEYIADKKDKLPAGVEIIVWEDYSEILQDRIGLLMKNGFLGIILVLLVLGVFLDIRLSFWVAMGMFLSFMGGLWAMTFFDVSINVISLFGFIMVLGIVVDDAIVIGESVFSMRERGEKPLEASRKGAKILSVPVVFAVLTTVATFSPLLFVEGVSGRVMYAVPVVVISVLLFSLFESLFILPAHLSSLKQESSNGILRASQNLSRTMDSKLKGFVEKWYIPLLQKSMAFPSLVIALSAAVLIFFIALLAGGRIDVQPGMGNSEGNSLRVFVNMPRGTALETTRDMTDSILHRLDMVHKDLLSEDEEKYSDFYTHALVSIGEQPSKQNVGNDPALAEVNILFPVGDERGYSLEMVQNRLREETLDLQGYEDLQFSSTMQEEQDDISISLSYSDEDGLQRAVSRLEDTLSYYDGVYDIATDFEPGREEIVFSLTPRGRSLGLTTADIAQQVRTAFYGNEILRVQRGNHDIPLMLRYPRRAVSELETVYTMDVRTPAGVLIPLREAANITTRTGYSDINRVNQNRVITLTAAVDPDISNSSRVSNDLIEYIQGDMQNDFPGLQHIVGGQQEDAQRSLASLGIAFIVALFVVYMLLAIPFKSYLEPLIIMCAIPFGAIGAFIGHILLGYDLQFMSVFGIVALSGVVVNDSLVFVNHVNRQTCRGLSIREAIVSAGRERFRPIMLTTLTTFAGLLPMLFETSFQARMLIPMAISLGVGILFASAITLILVPAFLILLDWFRRFFHIPRDCSMEASDA
jgi:multidrug efflux pump subunit AcrB